MLKKSLIITAALAVSFSFAHAKCGGGEKTVFSCVTEKGKQIEVCDGGKTIGYSFGKLGAKPDIAIKVPRAQVTTFQWNGEGPMYYDINIPNADVIYNVYWSLDRFSDPVVIMAGVNALKGEKTLASIKCVDKDIVQTIEGIKNIKLTESESY